MILVQEIKQETSIPVDANAQNNKHVQVIKNSMTFFVNVVVELLNDASFHSNLTRHYANVDALKRVVFMDKRMIFKPANAYRQFQVVPAIHVRVASNKEIHQHADASALTVT